MTAPTPLQLKRPLISIDLETTGVNVNDDRIVQIAFVRMEPDGTRATKARIINPARPIPKEATEVHGISNADVDGHPVFAQIAASLAKALSGADVTGYNVRSFDVPLLSAEFKRAGIDWPAEGTLVIDAYEIFKRQEPHRLAQALEFYTGELLGDAAHDAKADATAALDVLLGQASRYAGNEATQGQGATLEDMRYLSRDPDWIDAEGKVKWKGGVAVINFGKWADQPLQNVDPTYFDWVAKKDFADDFVAICMAAKAGNFPARGSL